MSKYFYYTGNSPFVQKYVDSKNLDGWKGWSENECLELIQGYWKTNEPHSHETVYKFPSNLELEDSEISRVVNDRVSSIEKKTVKERKKEAKNFALKEKVAIFVQKIKFGLSWFVKKLLMEENE